MNRGTCVACKGSESKYTCPYCQSTTCSLACYNHHKQATECQQARIQHSQANEGGPRLSLLRRNRGPPSRYVPMNAYDYNQMMEDYEFLNQVGRMVSSTGRAIYDSKLMNGVPNGLPGSSTRHVPVTQQRREALAKQLAFHKLPIMLLPDGMSKRKMNRTQWDAKRRCMLYTAQITFPCAPSQPNNPLSHIQKGGWLIHRLEGSVDMTICVLSEMERICARMNNMSLSQWKSHQSDPERAAKRIKSESSATPALISPSVWTSLGVPYASAHERGVLPENSVMLLHVYEKRLRNESSAKFLDWWIRKGSALESSNCVHSPTPSEPSIVPSHVLDAVSQLRPDKNDVAKSPGSSTLRQCYVRIEPGLSFEKVLRSIPTAYGIVEFFELEIWDIEACRDAERRNHVCILPLEPHEAVLENASRPGNHVRHNEAPGASCMNPAENNRDPNKNANGIGAGSTTNVATLANATVSCTATSDPPSSIATLVAYSSDSETEP